MSTRPRRLLELFLPAEIADETALFEEELAEFQHAAGNPVTPHWLVVLTWYSPRIVNYLIDNSFRRPSAYNGGHNAALAYEAYIERGNAYEREAHRIASAPELLSAHCAKLRYMPYAKWEIPHDAKQAYDRAIADFSEAILINPNSAHAHRLRAHSYDGVTDYDRAIADYSEAIRLDPSDPFGYTGRAGAYGSRNQAGDYDRAIADNSEAIRLDPNHIFGYWGRARTYADMKDHDRAIADYAEALRLDPDCIELREQLGHQYCQRAAVYTTAKQHGPALADCAQAIHIAPDNSYFCFRYVEACLDRGDAYREAKEYDRARADYAAATRIAPSNCVAFTKRADSYVDTKDYDRAFAEYDEWLRLHPMDFFYIRFRCAEAHRKRAEEYEQASDYDRALADYAEARRLDPCHWSIRRPISWERDKQADDREFAEYVARTRADVAPNDFNSIMADLELMRHDPELDMDEWLKEFSFCYDVARVYECRGDAYVEAKNYDRALNDYDEAMRIKSNSHFSLTGVDYNKYVWTYRARAAVKRHCGDDAGAAADERAARQVLIDNLADAEQEVAKSEEEVVRQREKLERNGEDTWEARELLDKGEKVLASREKMVRILRGELTERALHDSFDWAFYLPRPSIMMRDCAGAGVRCGPYNNTAIAMT
jgi:tetratricopeptide (TPR) repeat protein